MLNDRNSRYTRFAVGYMNKTILYLQYFPLLGVNTL